MTWGTTMHELLALAEAGDDVAVLQVLQVNPRLIGREGINRVMQRALTEPNHAFVKDLQKIGHRPLTFEAREDWVHSVGVVGTGAETI